MMISCSVQWQIWLGCRNDGDTGCKMTAVVVIKSETKHTSFSLEPVDVFQVTRGSFAFTSSLLPDFLLVLLQDRLSFVLSSRLKIGKVCQKDERIHHSSLMETSLIGWCWGDYVSKKKERMAIESILVIRMKRKRIEKEGTDKNFHTTLSVPVVSR